MNYILFLMCVFWNDLHVFLSVFCSSSAVWSCLCSPPSRITRGSPIKLSSFWYDSSHVYTTASASLFILCSTSSCTISTYACICVELFARGGTDGYVSSREDSGVVDFAGNRRCDPLILIAIPWSPPTSPQPLHSSCLSERHRTLPFFFLARFTPLSSHLARLYVLFNGGTPDFMLPLFILWINHPAITRPSAMSGLYSREHLLMTGWFSAP